MKYLVTVVLVSAVCFAQGARVPTVTRTVQQFGTLERDLISAKSSEARAALLTDDFEERLCAEPGTPVARAEWLQHPVSTDTVLSQPAVHMLRDVAIYSALLAHDGQSEMIVDTWTNADGSWKLAVRYRCPASGQKPAESTVPKRY